MVTLSSLVNVLRADVVAVTVVVVCDTFVIVDDLVADLNGIAVVVVVGLVVDDWTAVVIDLAVDIVVLSIFVILEAVSATAVVVRSAEIIKSYIKYKKQSKMHTTNQKVKCQ